MKLTFQRFLAHCGIAFSLASGIAHAGQVTIPNNFVAGTAAKSGEVNANFDALKTEVNDNDARITANAAAISNSTAAKQIVADDANGTEIGIMIGGAINYLLVRSPQGFVAGVRVFNGRVGDTAVVFFTDVDCGNSGGVAYQDFVGSQTGTGNEGPVPGSVFALNYSISGSPELWYLPKPATLVDNVAVLSVREWDPNTNSAVCTAAPVTLTTGARVFPNDPAVTGFPNAAFSAPITIEYR